MITLDSEPGNYIQLAGKTYSIFSGNNYLGLSGHPEIRKAAKEAIDRYGLNVAAARHTTGTTDIHLELEKELSDFKNREDSVVFASGYMGNGILLNALRDRYDTIYADEAAHPSIQDGIPRDIRPVHSYKHCDVGHLEDLMKKNKNSRPLIITDGIFPLTGEIAPLHEIHPLAEKYGAIIVTDDAHATGVLGEYGTGTPEHFQLAATVASFAEVLRESYWAQHLTLEDLVPYALRIEELLPTDDVEEFAGLVRRAADLDA